MSGVETTLWAVATASQMVVTALRLVATSREAIGTSLWAITTRREAIATTREAVTTTFCSPGSLRVYVAAEPMDQIDLHQSVRVRLIIRILKLPLLDQALMILFINIVLTVCLWWFLVDVFVLCKN